MSTVIDEQQSCLAPKTESDFHLSTDNSVTYYKTLLETHQERLFVTERSKTKLDLWTVTPQQGGRDLPVSKDEN